MRVRPILGGTQGVRVEKQEIRRFPSSDSRERGYTLIEFVIVAIILAVVAAMAVSQLMPSWQSAEADEAMAEVESAVRQARETAISQRRTIEIDFLTPATGTDCTAIGGVLQCIALYQWVVSGTPAVALKASSPFLVIPVGTDMQFLTVSGEPTLPSPDNTFGIPSPPSGLIFTGAVGNVAFQSDGTFTDSNATQLNGAIFLAEPGKPFTERAITILGATGKVRKWHGTGNGWFQAW